MSQGNVQVNRFFTCHTSDKHARMHSNRMRTARLLTVFHSIPCISGGGLPNPAGCRPHPPEGRPRGCRSPLDADPHGHVTCDACWEANPLPLWTNTLKILPCPKLRLQTIIMWFLLSQLRYEGRYCTTDC